MFTEQLDNVIFFLKTNPMIAVGGVIVLLALFYFRLKEMLKLAAFCLFIALVFYLITLLTGTVNTGSKQKDQMIYKSKEVLGE